MSLQPHNPDQSTLSLETGEEDFEIITSDEVDRVLDALDQLIESTTSENIRSHLEDAADCIYSLVYAEEELSVDAGEEQDEAA